MGKRSYRKLCIKRARYMLAVRYKKKAGSEPLSTLTGESPKKRLKKNSEADESSKLHEISKVWLAETSECNNSLTRQNVSESEQSNNVSSEEVNRSLVQEPVLTKSIQITDGLPKSLQNPVRLPKLIQSTDGLRKSIRSPNGLPKLIQSTDGLPKSIRSPNGLPKLIQSTDGLPKSIRSPNGLPKLIQSTDSLPKPIQNPDGLPKLIQSTDGLLKSIQSPDGLPYLEVSASNTKEVTIHVGRRIESSHSYKNLQNSFNDAVQNIETVLIRPPAKNDEPNNKLIALNTQALKITTDQIHANLQLYIGVPENCYDVLKLLYKHTNISVWQLFLCLKKVKLDTHFEELADEFGITLEVAKGIFLENIPIIAKNLQSFIMIESKRMKSNVSMPFRRYNTTTIIDSLELKVQPSSIQSRDLTQSEKGNTVKYLISCCPDGLINYVSSGYGGRQSDENLLQSTGYLERCEPGTCIITNGFKNAEPLLLEKGLRLLRPHQIVSTGAVQEVPLKYISKCYIERVMQRVREFTMIKDNSVISSDLLRVLDEVVVISCALINLQSFVKN